MNNVVERIEFFRGIIEAIQPLSPDGELPVKQMPYEEVFLTLPPDLLHTVVAQLVEQFDIRHLSTITADDVGDHLVLHYHFWHRYGLTLTIRLQGPNPKIDSVVDLIPGAAFYEREVFGMYGVTFVGHPDLHPLVLPEDWDDEPPMLMNQGEDEL